MRLRKEVIDRLSGSIASELMRYGYVETEMTEEELRFRLAEWISSDLRIEDLFAVDKGDFELWMFQGELARQTAARHTGTHDQHVCIHW